MMCIHAYFNIWCEAQAGWSVFMKRRSAVHKISALPEATSAQLQAFDDVCAICYQEMYSAKITRCRHYFHGVCLRKWLYVQDRCPLCHEIMMYTDRREESEADRAVHQRHQEQAAALAAAAAAAAQNSEDNSLSEAAENSSNTTSLVTVSTSVSGANLNSDEGFVTITNTMNSNSNSSTSSTAAAATFATAAASNTTHSFRFSRNLGMQD